VDIYVLNVHDGAAAQSAPAFLDPRPTDVSVYDKMEVSDPALVEFEDRDVLHGNAEPATQIKAEFIEYCPEISGRVALNLRWIERQRQKTPQLLALRDLSDQILVSLRLPWTAITTAPTFAIHTVKHRATIRRLAIHRPDTAISTSTQRLKRLWYRRVSIIL